MEVIQLTAAAQTQALKLLAERNATKQVDGLRIVAVGTDCQAHYQLGFDALKSTDVVHEYDNGLKVMVDEESVTPLKGCSLEFHDTSTQTGFEIINPKTSGCGGCSGNSGCK